MKNQIDIVMNGLKKRGKKALIAYLTAGYPSFKENSKIIRILKEGGVNILELGVPFSDPIADGPTIQFSSQQSLKNKTTLEQILRWIPKGAKHKELPIVLMTYLNPIYSFGLKNFAKTARRAGVSGLIVPDLIPEESRELRKILAGYGIHLIHLVAPTSPRSRQKLICRATQGFLYAVSLKGVTGARKSLPIETNKWLRGLQIMSPRPVCVGFGISRGLQIKQLKNSCDGFIVGSALIEIIRKNRPPNRLKKVKTFIRSLLKEC